MAETTPTPEKNEPIFFEDLHRNAREIQPMIFDGVKLALNRPLTPHFQLSHTISLGLMSSSYKFGANYMGAKRNLMDQYPLLASEIQFNGQMNANFIHMLSSRWKTKLVGSFAPTSCTGFQASLDYRGDNFTSTLTAANLDLIKNTGVLVGQLLHTFNQSFSIGPELLIQYGPSPKTDSLAMLSQLSLGGRYKADKFNIDATLSTSGAHISYAHKAHQNLNFGVEMMTDSSIKQATASFYYQYDLASAQTTFRGSVDTGMNVGALIERRFSPLPIALTLSAVLCHPKNSTSVGIGLQMG